MERVEVAIVGGGQAGLAVSRELVPRNVDHVVLEQGRVGQTWRDRWDSFCLVTPNWTVQLPGMGYDGDEPDGFMPRDEIVGYLERYAAFASAPVREGVAVDGVTRRSDGRFSVRTSSGELHAGAVVLATGTYQRPFLPPGHETLPASLPVLTLKDYRSPDSVPPGRVLVVGSGQSGCQLVEEMVEAGRDVVLSCGRAPWTPRRLGDHDIVWWLAESGFLDAAVTSLPTPDARLGGNITATGHGGGHDLTLRTLAADGATLTGRFLGADGRTVMFADDLAESVAWGDDRYRQIMALSHDLAAARGIRLPPVPEPAPFDARGPEQIAIADLSAVIFTGGYRPDYGMLAPWPEAFDDMGFPIQLDGTSPVVPGLFFVGVHFMRKRKSSLLYGVGEDASLVAEAVAARVR